MCSGYIDLYSACSKYYLYQNHDIVQIPGYKYMCELRDPSGLSIVTNAINSIPINESQAVCQIEQNQVSMHVYHLTPSVQLTPTPPLLYQIIIPESSMTGVMALQLNLVLANENRSFAHVIEWEKGIGDGTTMVSHITLILIYSSLQGNLYSDGNMMEEPPTTIPSANQTSFNSKHTTWHTPLYPCLVICSAGLQLFILWP